jgi:hypothetical protein
MSVKNGLKSTWADWKYATGSVLIVDVATDRAPVGCNDRVGRNVALDKGLAAPRSCGLQELRGANMKKKLFSVQYAFSTSYDTVVEAKNEKEAAEKVLEVIGEPIEIESVWEVKREKPRD